MGQYVAKLSLAFLASGCSLIYNPSQIDKPMHDGSMIDSEIMIDARIDAPPLFDANPSMLTLEALAPATLLEGQGIGGSRPALLVIRGHHIVPDGLDVTIMPSTGLTIGAPIRSNNGDFIAVPVTVAINAATSGTADLTVIVMQTGGPGPVTLGGLKVQYLPEFPAGTTIATGALAPLYSQVSGNNITFTGTAPAVVRSVSSIELGNITARGGDATTGTNVGAAGPGGCAGGASGAQGGCPSFVGGGGGATGNSGGGGGGFAATASPGNGANAGPAGAAHGNAQLVNYVGDAATTNQSSGGGGGGATSLSSAGAGGGGGGTVELTAGGDISVGTLNASGGNGGDATTLLSGSGGGGGGSGGVIVVRSDAGSITAAGLTANAGLAGAGASGAGGSGAAGGAGSAGRIRIDAAGTIPTTTPASHRGPAFTASTTSIVMTDNPMLMLVGTTDDILDGFVVGMDGLEHFGEPMNQTFANGMLAITPTLLPGYNKLCFTLRPGTRNDADKLADKCIEMAYLP